MKEVVRVERTIPAPPQQVYRAWLDPEVLRLWMAPGDLRVARVDVDERVGGHYRVWLGEDGEAGGWDSELLELVPGERIVLRWGFVGPERRDGPAYDSLLTITLREAPGGGTLLTLVHERLDELAAERPDIAKDVAPGWESVLDNLTAALDAPGH
jgi:uncharacterized protein YndB with AHSA1/START domain